MKPYGNGNERLRETLCGSTASRDRLVAAHNGKFYRKAENGYPEVDASKICGNCKRILRSKER